MSDTQKQEYLIALLDFVKRAAKEGATAEEVQALPAVAGILQAIVFPSY